MSNNKTNLSKVKLSEFKTWYVFKSNKSKLPKNLNNLIDFYVFSCPSFNTNIQAMQISDYGWRTRVDKSLLSRRLKNVLPKGKFINVSSYDELLESLNTNKELLEAKIVCESVCFKTDNNTVSEVLFYAIRNSFAHGSFVVKKSKNETYFFMENRRKGTLTARMIVKDITLQKWIEILKKK